MTQPENMTLARQLVRHILTFILTLNAEAYRPRVII